MAVTEPPHTQPETPARPLPDDYWEGELVPPTDPRAAVISINPERMSGTPCFVGTRVPIRNLWDYLAEGPSMDDFLDGFPSVTHEQAKAVLRLACERLLEGLLIVQPQALQESGLSIVQLQRLAAAGIASVNPNIVSGAVVFAGTRVPIYNLWDYLNGGDSIEDFLESFPTVRREQIQQALELVPGSMVNGRLPAREHSL